MTVRSRLFDESFVRALAVLGAAALALTLLPAPAQAQQDENDFDFDPRAACPVDAPESDFNDRDDIPDDHVNNVDCGAFFDIVLGFEDGDFRPSIPVRRDQMASFIARTLDSADVDLPEASEGKDFDDVSADNPHRDNIRRLEAAGITLGAPLDLSEDDFGPELRTRRDQMTSFIIRGGEHAFGEEFDSSDQQFPDVPEGNVHFENINFAAQVGIVLGFDEDTFGPGLHTRRDQMTAFIVRLLNFLTTPADVEITEQSAESATVGETITATATVWSQFRDEAEDTASGDDSATLEGEEVDFSAEHAETTGVTVPAETQTVETNEDGEAAFDFTSSQPGTVTVTASIDGPGGAFVHADGDSDSAEKQFTADLNVSPAEATNLAPQTDTTTVDHTVSADLGDEPNEDIRFDVFDAGGDPAANADPDSGVVSTGPDGEPAEFTYSFDQVLGEGESVEHTIVACEDDGTTCAEVVDGELQVDDGERLSGTATKTWVGPTNVVENVDLSWENEFTNPFGNVDDPAARLGSSGTVDLAYNTDIGAVSTVGDATVSSPIPDDGTPAGPNHHLHAGALGENGPVEIPLATPQHVGGDDPDTTPRGSFDYSLTGQVQDESFIPVLEDLDSQLAAAGAGEVVDYYVNVHTVDNPGGEIRGQLPDGGQDLLPPVYQQADQNTAGDPSDEVLLTFNEAVLHDPDLLATDELDADDFTVTVDGVEVDVVNTRVGAGSPANWEEPAESHFIEIDATLTGDEDVSVTFEPSGQAKVIAEDDDQAVDSVPTRSFEAVTP